MWELDGNMLKHICVTSCLFKFLVSIQKCHYYKFCIGFIRLSREVVIFVKLVCVTNLFTTKTWLCFDNRDLLRTVLENHRKPSYTCFETSYTNIAQFHRLPKPFEHLLVTKKCLSNTFSPTIRTHIQTYCSSFQTLI